MHAEVQWKISCCANTVNLFLSILLCARPVFHADLLSFAPFDRIMCAFGFLCRSRCERAPLINVSLMVRRTAWAQTTRRQKKNWARRFQWHVCVHVGDTPRHCLAKDIISIFWHNGRKHNFNNNRSVGRSSKSQRSFEHEHRRFPFFVSLRSSVGFFGLRCALFDISPCESMHSTVRHLNGLRSGRRTHEARLNFSSCLLSNAFKIKIIIGAH